MSHSNPEPPVWAVNLFGLNGYELMYAGRREWWPTKRGRRLVVSYTFNSRREFYHERLKTWEDPDAWSGASVQFNT